jgi:hypothetical protein
MRGAAHSVSSDTVLASNGLIHPDMLQVFAEVFQGRYATPLPQL